MNRAREWERELKQKKEKLKRNSFGCDNSGEPSEAKECKYFHELYTLRHIPWRRGCLRCGGEYLSLVSSLFHARRIVVVAPSTHHRGMYKMKISRFITHTHTRQRRKKIEISKNCLNNNITTNPFGDSVIVDISSSAVIRLAGSVTWTVERGLSCCKIYVTCWLTVHNSQLLVMLWFQIFKIPSSSLSNVVVRHNS